MAKASGIAPPHPTSALGGATTARVTRARGVRYTMNSAPTLLSCMPASGVVWRCCHQTIAVIKAPAPRADQRNVSSPLRANSTVHTMTSAPTRASGHSVAAPRVGLVVSNATTAPSAA